MVMGGAGLASAKLAGLYIEKACRKAGHRSPDVRNRPASQLLA
jgi:hypothetical protein